LKQLPRQLIVYGVEAQNLEAGTNLSPAIEIAMPSVVERVLQELSWNSPSSRK
jgi:Ni,Fe-hydrogenase maturation factor